MAELTDFIDPDEIAEALTGEEVHQGKLELARRGVEYAKSIAPVDSGEYQDGLDVEDDGDEVYVAAYDPISNLIEYGTQDTPEFAILARTEVYINSLEGSA
jgi:hypothetical protein